MSVVGEREAVLGEQFGVAVVAVGREHLSAPWHTPLHHQPHFLLLVVQLHVQHADPCRTVSGRERRNECLSVLLVSSSDSKSDGTVFEEVGAVAVVGDVCEGQQPVEPRTPIGRVSTGQRVAHA
eukprot:3566617-Rhodomonas_salina.1